MKEERLKKRYWNHHLKNAIQAKFLYALNDSEMKSEFDLKNDGLSAKSVIS